MSVRKLKSRERFLTLVEHGGKKMFIFDENEDTRVKIEAGEGIPSFDASLEGSDVLVSGMLKELIIDETYLIGMGTGSECRNE